MFGLGVPEVILIVVVFAILFGAERITKLGSSLGRFTGEFKKGQLEVEKEIRNVKESLSSGKDSKKS
jgi:sec-independent protein translocase protein TatA